MGRRSNDFRDDTVSPAGGEIAYRYCRSRRRTLGITVRPDGTVTVRAPLSASLASIRAFVEERAPWIRKACASFLRRPPPKPRRYVHGEPHLYLGREFPLEVAAGQTDSVRLTRSGFRVTTRREPTEAAVERVMDGWYRAQGERLFRRRLDHWHRIVAREGIPAPALRMRKMTSRWGSWSAAAVRVNLSLLLLRAPLACVDYVVLHELCHARYRSHGPRFWALVGKYMPDYAERRRRLNGYAA